VDVYAIQQRTGNTRAVALHHGNRTGAFMGGIR
jgi:hypothetical protein